MLTFNPNFPTIVQTGRGNIPLDSVNVGDIVYCYNSGRELEVKGLTHFDETIYKVTFNDGRSSFYTAGEIENLKKITLAQFMVDYHKKNVLTPLYPDPYIAGALFIYGDQSDENLNLEVGAESANNLFANKYQLNYTSEVATNGKYYFRYDGDSPLNRIKWKDFFKDYMFKANPGDCQDPPIVPIDYHRSSIADRMKFIRGVFDVGYRKGDFKGNTVGISNKSKEKLFEVQKILWSLGILSVINFDDTICSSRIGDFTVDNRNLSSDGGIVNAKINLIPDSLYDLRTSYKLYILGKHSFHPGFFYNVDSIENLIDNIYQDKKYLRFQLKMKSVELFTKTKVQNILLENKYMTYLTSNFLPKISGRK